MQVTIQPLLRSSERWLSWMSLSISKLSFLSKALDTKGTKSRWEARVVKVVTAAMKAATVKMGT